MDDEVVHYPPLAIVIFLGLLLPPLFGAASTAGLPFRNIFGRFEEVVSVAVDLLNLVFEGEVAVLTFLGLLLAVSVLLLAR